MVRGTHRGSVKDGGAETSRRATAPRRQPPHGVGKRWRQSPSLTPRRGGRQSPSAVALFLSKKKGKRVQPEAGLPRAPSVSNPTSRCSNSLGSVVLTLDELRHVTNSFSDDQILGEGAFGKVYKGVLKNGDTIAVKRFASTITGLQDVQYENEAKHLMRLKHPNIVQLVGYCSETETKLVRHNGIFVRAEQSERLLCLEYMPKGNLRGHLSDETSGLEWETRYKIIKGICYGLHYLHEEWQVTGPIIHMDLKPANILLDDTMVPKIADFGLSRLFGEEQTRTCTTSCKGTPGYMAPEYLEKGVITKMFDIFSLGVIIIEIITGLKGYPTYETKTASQQYIDLVLNNWRHRLRKAQGYTSQGIDHQQIKKCIQIGLLCVKIDPAKRPTINQIIKLLERSEEAYKYERKIREEAAKALASFLCRARAPSLSRTLVDQNQPPRYKLCFMNGLDAEVFTKKVICDTDGEPLKIRVVANGQDGTDDAHILSAKIKVVVLAGDFNRHNQECWTPEEFSNYIVRPRDKVGAILTGDLELSLANGKAYLRGATFIDCSMFVRCCKFRLGVMVTDDLSERVQEGITEPFVVLKRSKKHDLPLLNDHVWRLKRIAKDGAFHDALRGSGIMLVKDFLRLYYTDEQALREILIEATEVVWTTIVKHAKKCDPGGDIYSYFLDDANSVMLFFNSVYQIVGVKFVDYYSPFDDLEKTTKDLVVQWSRVAYENMSFNQPDYEMGDDGIPRLKDDGMFQV